MEVTIGSFAKIVGTTVRTLRYYDKMGLLSPNKLNDNGNKVYTRKEWESYQQINIYKHLGLTLNEIKEQMTDNKVSNRELLRIQKTLIEEKQEQLNELKGVITRMERLYNFEDTSEGELDQFAFIMLDLFMREKKQMQAFEQHFNEDKQLMEQIKSFNEPESQDLMDKITWELFQAIKDSIQCNDAASKQKVHDTLEKMDRLFPANEKFLFRVIDDDSFFEKHSSNFNNYFPEEIGDYMYKEMKAYYQEKQDRAADDGQSDSKKGN
ncbi:MerR family transcriptional regulator [Geomicrobium sp. JCM 19055]|uniref:MerR family transcriptional regulator n=1 Tax=Geomicrobium sp. JCM 19055 TaxID=1460649 RepID=UPI00045ECEE4|nr:MerR family transcriptional regulator [Geomicrobium sp. JCM 19055]GAJ97802.1 transcriptional regulator, MerR family [Geomicrobium sp. JCM 19055]